MAFKPPFIPPGSKYPLPVLKSSWNRIKKPSRRTLVNIMRGSEFVTGRNPKIVFRNSYNALSSRLDDLIFFQDPRPRNQLGMFTSQEEGGPDPNAMVRTYHTPVGPGAISAGTTAAIGGASGTGAALAVKALAEKIKQMRKARIR